MPKTSLLLLLLALLAACTRPPELAISNAYAYAPVTERGSAAAYMTLRNMTSVPIQITAFRSADFALVALHETVERDSKLYMQPLRNVEIAAGAVLRLQPGGRHLMMMSPRRDILAGDTGSLTIETAGGNSFNVTLPFYDRIAPPVEQPS